MDQTTPSQAHETNPWDLNPDSGLTSGLPIYAYTSEDFFAQEQTELFAKTCNSKQP
jgi:hypothetical protein